MKNIREHLKNVGKPPIAANTGQNPSGQQVSINQQRMAADMNGPQFNPPSLGGASNDGCTSQKGLPADNENVATIITHKKRKKHVHKDSEEARNAVSFKFNFFNLYFISNRETGKMEVNSAKTLSLSTALPKTSMLLAILPDFSARNA